jgi:hypothetical protein
MYMFISNGQQHRPIKPSLVTTLGTSEPGIDFNLDLHIYI